MGSNGKFDPHKAFWFAIVIAALAIIWGLAVLAATGNL